MILVFKMLLNYTYFYNFNIKINSVHFWIESFYFPLTIFCTRLMLQPYCNAISLYFLPCFLAFLIFIF
nr:MAG TPA: hypothetical protein [Caudoviricetes sp.]